MLVRSGRVPAEGTEWGIKSMVQCGWSIGRNKASQLKEIYLSHRFQLFAISPTNLATENVIEFS